MKILNENISHDDLKKYIKELYNYIAKELNIDVPPRVFLRRDKTNADDIFGKTGGYDPDAQEIHLYITNRHPKDVLRSFAHELVHHMQKLQGLNDKVNIDLIHRDEAYAQHDEGLKEMEREAFEKGNMLFRAWTDGKKLERKKLMAEMKKSDITAAHKKAKSMMPSMKKQYGAKKGEEIAYATATKQAKEDMAARHGKNIEEQGLGSNVGEEQENLEENQKSETQHPYPQLLEEKPRLMQDAFNKKEDLVYQELIRRFIKK